MSLASYLWERRSRLCRERDEAEAEARWHKADAWQEFERRVRAEEEAERLRAGIRGLLDENVDSFHHEWTVALERLIKESP